MLKIKYMEEIKFIYTISHEMDNRSVATVTYEYERKGEDGLMKLRLQGVRFLNSTDETFKRVVLTHVNPVLWHAKGMDIEQLFPGWRKHHYIVKDVTAIDVSFERFWNLYGKKVGNKGGVEKRWSKLEWEEKVMALGCVPRMRQYYERKGLDLPYPETYVNQRRWENEFDN